MLLIYGDLTVTTWYFVFAVYSIARGTVKTQSRFCQSSGFMIQYGAETSGKS
jgi:G protein-coupled receptor GPR1